MRREVEREEKAAALKMENTLENQLHEFSNLLVSEMAVETMSSVKEKAAETKISSASSL